MVKAFWAACAVLILSGSLGCAALGNALRPPPPIFKDPTTGMALVRVPGGCYQMGNVFDGGGPEEKPAHEVCLGDFYVGQHEVTQGEWKAVMGSNPSEHASCSDACPVEMVSWDDVQAFLARLNARSAGGQYRLPTEAEWEYAARSGGKREKYSGGSDDVGQVAWYLWNAEGPHPVGTRAPNGLGLHDMTGNVWEWTADWYGEAYYAASPRQSPTGPATGDRRVVRGGSYANEAFDVRACYRNFLPPDHRSGSKGFRLAATGLVKAR